MKNFLIEAVGIIVFIALMILPGFVIYIVGNLANSIIPDRERGDLCHED